MFALCLFWGDEETDKERVSMSPGFQSQGMAWLGETSHAGEGGRGSHSSFPLLGISFEPSRLSARLGWSTVACATHSGLGQENLAEVSFYLYHGEEQGLHLCL